MEFVIVTGNQAVISNFSGHKKICNYIHFGIRVKNEYIYMEDGNLLYQKCLLISPNESEKHYSDLLSRLDNLRPHSRTRITKTFVIDTPEEEIPDGISPYLKKAQILFKELLASPFISQNNKILAHELFSIIPYEIYKIRGGLDEKDFVLNIISYLDPAIKAYIDGTSPDIVKSKKDCEGKIVSYSVVCNKHNKSVNIERTVCIEKGSHAIYDDVNNKMKTVLSEAYALYKENTDRNFDDYIFETSLLKKYQYYYIHEKRRLFPTRWNSLHSLGDELFDFTNRFANKIFINEVIKDYKVNISFQDYFKIPDEFEDRMNSRYSDNCIYYFTHPYFDEFTKDFYLKMVYETEIETDILLTKKYAKKIADIFNKALLPDENAE